METAKTTMLWFAFIFACFVPASALSSAAPENWVWEIFSIGYDPTPSAVISPDSGIETPTSDYDTAPIPRATTEAKAPKTERTLFGHNTEFKAAETGATAPMTGSQWYQYFSAKYGAENVSWARLPEYAGGKTTGVLATPVGDIDLLSGMNGPVAAFGCGEFAGRNGAIMWHVESHAAAAMRQLGLSKATLYINRVPCGPAQGWWGGCEFMLDRMLPEGAQLPVIGQDGYNMVFGVGGN